MEFTSARWDLVIIISSAQIAFLNYNVKVIRDGNRIIIFLGVDGIEQKRSFLSKFKFSPNNFIISGKSIDI